MRGCNSLLNRIAKTSCEDSKRLSLLSIWEFQLEGKAPRWMISYVRIRQEDNVPEVYQAKEKFERDRGRELRQTEGSYELFTDLDFYQNGMSKEPSYKIILVVSFIELLRKWTARTYLFHSWPRFSMSPALLMSALPQDNSCCDTQTR